METKTVYFEDASANNTDEALKLAKQRADELGIKSIIVASTKGGTGLKAAEVFRGYNLIVVSHAVGFWKPNTRLFSDENIQKIESAGGKVLTTGHAFGGASISSREKFNTIQINDVIAHTLRVFGQGIKVACEIILMATDAGLVDSDEKVIAMAGTGKVGGADTAVVASAVNSNRFFDLKVHEIICKSRL